MASGVTSSTSHCVKGEAAGERPYMGATTRRKFARGVGRRFLRGVVHAGALAGLQIFQTLSSYGDLFVKKRGHP